MASHGDPAVFTAPGPARPQRPLTAEEKLDQTSFDIEASPKSSEYGGDLGKAQHEELTAEQETGFLARMREWEAAMDRKLGIESQAIERKLPEDRVDLTWKDSLTMASLWASGTMNLSCFATGFLGWEMGLDLKQSILICIFGSLLGGSVSGFCASLGAPTGLRQISISRYSFGWWPTKLVAVLNTIQQVGWSSAGCITGGIALNAVADGKVSTTVGIVIIAVCSMIVSFFGIKAILPFERYAWLVYLVVFLIILGQTGSSADPTPNTSLKGLELSGTILSLLAVVYGSSASWCSCASDYYVLYPPTTSRTKVFLLTTLGVSLPTAFCMICGCVTSSALNNQPAWADAYNNNGGSGLGFLLQTALHPSGFAKFLLVLLVLSGINCNIINTYSAALSCQQFARPFARIPRVLWTIACFGAILAIALAGRNSLLSYLENFLSLLGYWCTSYFVIVATEHFLFRKGNVALNYDLEAWNDPARLPWGLAALASFLLGVVMWCMGMVETWFVGPVGGLIGEGGGDVANEMTFAMTLVAYVPLRWLELRFVGR